MSKLKVDQISKASGASPATFTLPAADGTAGQYMKTDGSGALSFGTVTIPAGGKILQVLQTVKTDTFTTTSTSFVDVTGLSVSITPATTSSKILILVHAYGGNAGTSSANALTTLVRDSTEVFIGDAASNRIRSTTTIGPTRSATGYGYSMHISYLDSPSTTSSTTYKLQAKAADSGTFVLGRDGDDADQANEGRTPSSIIVMEVGA